MRYLLCVHTHKMKTWNDVDLRRPPEDTELFAGTELEGLCKEAGIVALREDISATGVCDRHVQIAKNSIKPELTKVEIDSYSSFMKTSSRTLPNHFEAGLKPVKSKKNRLDPLSLVKIGVVGCLLLLLLNTISCMENKVYMI
ncbi:hypothetical protein Fmac_003151 [Flemingia macrophylla]|uniref:AAA ATPase AAA+ lid domain-containing protein n=1 Tax=Flemingia macrophylla TaxID=520843 RepID=A0ABD1NLY7_9FABA